MNRLLGIFGGSPAVGQMNAQQVQQRLSEGWKPYILDVREPEEFAEGHLAGAHLGPLGQLQQVVRSLPKDQEILCVCRSGSRSSMAARQLQSAGFRTTNLSGGMLGWARAGFPIQGGKKPGKGRG